MNSPVDQHLLQLVQQDVKSLEDVVENVCEESEKEKKKVLDELQKCWTALEDTKQKLESVENRVDGFEYRVDGAERRIDDFENRVFRVEGGVTDLTGKC